MARLAFGKNIWRSSPREIGHECPYLRLTYAPSKRSWTCQQFCTSMYLQRNTNTHFSFFYEFSIHARPPPIILSILHWFIHLECFFIHPTRISTAAKQVAQNLDYNIDFHNLKWERWKARVGTGLWSKSRSDATAQMTSSHLILRLSTTDTNLRLHTTLL